MTPRTQWTAIALIAAIVHVPPRTTASAGECPAWSGGRPLARIGAHDSAPIPSADLAPARRGDAGGYANT